MNLSELRALLPGEGSVRAKANISPRVFGAVRVAIHV